MEGATKLQPKSSLQLHLVLPYVTHGGCKTIAFPSVTIIMHQAEQVKQCTGETVHRDFTTIHFHPGMYHWPTRLPVGLLEEPSCILQGNRKANILWGSLKPPLCTAVSLDNGSAK